jgi:hypothetical protein
LDHQRAASTHRTYRPISLPPSQPIFLQMVTVVLLTELR